MRQIHKSAELLLLLQLRHDAPGGFLRYSQRLPDRLCQFMPGAALAAQVGSVGRSGAQGALCLDPLGGGLEDGHRLVGPLLHTPALADLVEPPGGLEGLATKGRQSKGASARNAALAQRVQPLDGLPGLWLGLFRTTHGVPHTH